VVFLMETRVVADESSAGLKARIIRRTMRWDVSVSVSRQSAVN